MNSIFVRTARVDDLQAMLKLYQHLNPDDPIAAPEDARAAWDRLVNSDLAMIFVAEAGGEIASSCTLVVVPNITRSVQSYALIENVVTHGGHRRKGFGRAVLDAALAAAWRAGCYKVMFATGSQREETLRFYEKAGFRRGGKTFFQATPQQ